MDRMDAPTEGEVLRMVREFVRRQNDYLARDDQPPAPGGEGEMG